MKSFVFTLVLLALCTGGNVARASPACGKCRDRTGFKIGLVAYLDETDVIKSGDLLSGFLEAAKLVRVQPLVFKASPTSGTSPTRDVVQALSLELDNAMAAGVNAVVTVLPNLSGLEAKLQQLHDANITVVSVDTGHTALRTALADTLSPNSHLPLVHIGYDEEEEGLEAGRQLALAGGRHVICVLDGNVNDISSQTRCQGFADGFMSNCRADEACGVDTLTVSDMSNIELVNQEIEALVTGNPNINGVVSNKGKVLVRARQLLVKHERVVGTTYLVGAFGMDAEVQSMLTNRELTFAVDHQEYLNAFMATTIASYALAHRQAPASRLLSTRPHFTTVARAIERNLDMRVATSDVIIHGRSIDDFWKGFSVGIVEAANDLQLAFRECKDGDDTEACADGAQRTLTYR
jgi:ABC-type sugar transport system substrate-binding protein